MNDNCEKLRTLHEFWFQGHDGWGNEEVGKRWFAGGEELDRLLVNKFPGLDQEAGQGVFDDCAANDGSMAASLVIALGRLPRNLHRGTAEAFACDAKAIALAKQMVGQDRLKDMWPCERLFVLMPYQHSEDLETQHQSVELFQQLSDSAPGDGQGEFFKGTVKYAELHRDIVVRFGRFPHRNKALGRETTKEEKEYLEGGGETFGQ